MNHRKNRTRKPPRRAILAPAAVALLAATLAGRAADATTYVSAEPIPSPRIVGAAKLAAIENLGYADRAQWAGLLLGECRIVANVIRVLRDNAVIGTVTDANTSAVVAAGGYQGVTDPSYVLTFRDRGPGSASAADIFALDNALGYTLNQGGTAQFGLPYDPGNAYEFSIAYAVVTFAGGLTGEQAQAFFDYLGTIDPALWTGANAGFTQIGVRHAPEDNAMLFLIGNVSKTEFAKGLAEAARTTPGATYAPLGANGQPRTASAGAAFPGNGWTTPSGGYLENLPDSPTLLGDLRQLRQRHLRAVADLVNAIDHGTVPTYLGTGFSCP
jgi:hypothetical protein